MFKLPDAVLQYFIDVFGQQVATDGTTCRGNTVLAIIFDIPRLSQISRRSVYVLK